MDCISLFLSIKFHRIEGGEIVEIITYHKDSTSHIAVSSVGPYA